MNVIRLNTQTLVIRPNEEGKFVIPISAKKIDEYARDIPGAGLRYKKSA